ncbi:MAG: polysaccharide deacetylase family protein [Anditalea sp.]
MRNIVSFFYGSLLIFFGFVRRARKRAMKGEFILSIYFHRPSKKEFETIIKWLIKKKFEFISVVDLKKIIEEKLPFPKGAILLTVDDGWATNETNIVDIANKLKIPVTIFISTQAAEEGVFWWSYVKEAKKKKLFYPSSNDLKKVPNQDRLDLVSEIKSKINLPRETMSIEQIRQIEKSDFITIGGHTHSHPILPNCDDEHIHYELSISKQKLETWLNKEVDIFAFPNGSYSESELRILKSLNYNLGFGNHPKYCSPEDLKNKYIIPRLAFLEGASLAENICRVTGVWSTHTKSIFKKYNKI